MPVTSSSHGIRVLHVDDEPSFTDLTATYLEREDDRFTVQTATNAEEGRKKLEDNDLDCIVSDYDMPGRNGIEFLRTVREDFSDLPFILFTGKGSEEVASEAISAGVTDYIQKHGGGDQFTLLANRLTNAVEGYQARQEADWHRTVIKNMGEGVYVWDDDYTFQFVNFRVSDQKGLSEENWVDQPLSYLTEIELLSESELEAIIHATDRLFAGETDQTSLTIEPSLPEPDQILELSLASVQSSDNENLILGTTRDISDRIEYERELERKTRAIEEAPVGITLTDPDQDENPIIYENRHFLDLTGYSREFVRGRNPRFLQGEDTATEPVATMREAVAEEKSVTVELRNYRQDGTEFWNQVRIAPVEDETGTVTNYVGFQSDITNRKHHEQELERYETIVEALGDPVYALNADGEFTYVNEALVRMAGVSEDNLLGEHVSMLFPSEDVSRGVNLITDLLDDETRHAGTIEMTMEPDDEVHIPTENHIALLPPAEDGSFRGTAGVIRDITDRKQTEERLEAYIDNASDILGIVTEDGVFRDLSQSVERVLGYEPAELEDEIVFEYVHPDDRDRVFAEFVEMVDSEDTQTKRVEYRFKHANGSWQWIESIGSDRTHSTLEGYVITTRDISERKEREQELKQQNERLEEFTSVVSHDLRNPLHIAQQRVELAREDRESEHLDAAVHAHNRMEELIDELLTLAREGEGTSEQQTVSVLSLSDAAWKTVETGEATLVTDTDQRICADPDRLRQLLENLIANAVEHGGPDVTVTIEEMPDEAGFFVADDGPGIPDTDRERVFESGYSTAQDGTGFGLAIVMQVVEAHDWEITITDSAAGGARFEITNVETPDA